MNPERRNHEDALRKLWRKAYPKERLMVKRADLGRVLDELVALRTAVAEARRALLFAPGRGGG